MGAAVAHVLMGMKQAGKLKGVFDSVKFFISTMPWKTLMGGSYAYDKKQIPTLSIFGKNDPLVGIMKQFADYHEGRHELPVITDQLRTKISALLQFSGVERVSEN